MLVCLSNNRVRLISIRRRKLPQSSGTAIGNAGGIPTLIDV